MKTVMRNGSDNEMIFYFTELIIDFKSRGINPGFHLTDNKASPALKMEMTTMDINYHLVLPNNHRSNNTERLIQTFKNYFILVLCSVDENFHLQLWYRLLQQAKTSLNLLRQSIIHPHLSAYTHIFGEFD